MTIPVTRQLIAKIKTLLSKREPPSFHEVLKYDRNQPRGAKGTHTGGRWVKDVSAGEGGTESSSSFTPPAYGFGSTEDRRMAANNQASYAAIMNAPTGTGFKNTPRGVNIPEPTAEPVSTGNDKVLSVLKTGTVTDSRPLGGGVNASVVVTLDDGTEAIYKPERGEAWHGSFANSDISRYIKNTDFSLAEREAFAFEVDHALGLGLVPETVLRENVDETHIDVNTEGHDDGYDDGGGGYDEDYAREQYDAYKEKHQDSLLEKVGEEMYSKFQEAQDEHVKDLDNRAQEILDIWNEEAKDFPDNPAGSPSALREHPALPLGSKTPFERRDTPRVLDPLDVIDEAEVDPTAALSAHEKVKVREVVRQKLEEGYQEFGDINPEKAKEHLEYDTWREEHEDTENQLYESKMQSFTSWRRSQGYNSSGGGGGGGTGEDQNPDAPHPRGGSFQNFRSDAESWGDINAADGARLATLDYAIGTMDRHGSNLLYENDRPVAIDNGYSMPGGMDSEDDFTFRSDGVGNWLHSNDSRKVPSNTRAQLHEALTQTDWKALVDRHPNMTAEEREAFLGRVENLKIALQTEEGLRALWRKQQRM